MKRIHRGERLNAENVPRQDAVRTQVSEEFPERIVRHRLAADGALLEHVEELKSACESMGLNLSDLTELTDTHRAPFSKMEAGRFASQVLGIPEP